MHLHWQDARQRICQLIVAQEASLLFIIIMKSDFPRRWRSKRMTGAALEGTDQSLPNSDRLTSFWVPCQRCQGGWAGPVFRGAPTVHNQCVNSATPQWWCNCIAGAFAVASLIHVTQICSNTPDTPTHACLNAPSRVRRRPTRHLLSVQAAAPHATRPSRVAYLWLSYWPGVREMAQRGNYNGRESLAPDQRKAEILI